MIVSPQPRQTTEQKKQKPWWNRPLIGDRSLFERLFQRRQKSEILDSTLKLHDEVFNEIKLLANRSQSLDHAKFGSKDFLEFLRLNRLIQDGNPPYHGLIGAIALLQAGITAHQSFTALEQVEFTHRGIRFNDMYGFVEDLCVQRVLPETFRRQVRSKSVELYPRLKSTEGQQALHRYTQHLERIGKHELSLNLLFAFKKHNYHSYKIFKLVSDLINQVQRQDLTHLDAMMTQVIAQFESFESLGAIIGLQPSQRTLKIYGILFQYIAMLEKHKTAFSQFEILAKQLEKWKGLEEKLVQIRQEYPANLYRRPKQFSASVPGEHLYYKYASYFE